MKNLRRREFLLGSATVAGATALPLVSQALKRTPRQVIGPFYPLPDERLYGEDNDLVLIKGHDSEASGQRVHLEGRILDQNGNPVRGAWVELWQADGGGRYRHPADRNRAPLDPHFQGYGKMQSDEKGAYRFRTIRPSGYWMDANHQRAPHIHFRVTLSGHRTLGTQMYFAGEPLNEQDFILNGVRDPEERARLIVSFTKIKGASVDSVRGQFDLVI